MKIFQKMNANPLFSVLMANYNNGRYLQEAIDSVLEQTYPNWEIILVDDKSTDNSFEIYEKYKDDSRFHIYHNERNMGCGYTKRRCVELANGEICGFLDPDDALFPDAMDKHVARHIEGQDCSCVFSRYYDCDESFNITGESRLLQLSEGEAYLTHGQYCPEHLCSFKKAMYEQTEGIAVDLKLGVDQDLYFKLEEVGPICVLDAFTYKYRLHSTNISQDSTNIDVYWNLIARHRACLRRGIDPSLHTVKDFVAFQNERFEQGADSVRRSKAYKLGRALLTSFSWIRRR